MQLLHTVLAFVAIWFVPPANAQQYATLTVKNRVQVQVPSDWTINDSEHRQRVADLTREYMGSQGHVASLSVASYPQPSRAFLRVSFVPMDPPITQADLLQEIRTNRAGTLRDMAEVWSEEYKQMGAGLAKMGTKLLTPPKFDIEQIGGRTAMTISYGRSSMVNKAEVMRVAQYHVVLGSEKALITISHIEGDGQAKAAVERIKSSISIR